MKFNEEICKDLCEYRKKGLTIKDCADLVGINRHTVTKWVQKGQKAKSGKYHDFYKQWKKATAQFKLLHLEKIDNSRNWEAHKYLLQVTDPEQYVVEERTKVSADVKHDTNLSEFAKIMKESLKNVQD